MSLRCQIFNCFAWPGSLYFVCLPKLTLLSLALQFLLEVCIIKSKQTFAIPASLAMIRASSANATDGNLSVILTLKIVTLTVPSYHETRHAQSVDTRNEIMDIPAFYFCFVSLIHTASISMQTPTCDSQ